MTQSLHKLHWETYYVYTRVQVLGDETKQRLCQELQILGIDGPLPSQELTSVLW